MIEPYLEYVLSLIWTLEVKVYFTYFKSKMIFKRMNFEGN